MVTINSFFISVMGVAVGIMAAYMINMFIRMFIFLVLGNQMSYNLNIESVFLGVSVGFLIPFVANFSPVKSVMQFQLRDALN